MIQILSDIGYPTVPTFRLVVIIDTFLSQCWNVLIDLYTLISVSYLWSYIVFRFPSWMLILMSSVSCLWSWGICCGQHQSMMYTLCKTTQWCIGPHYYGGEKKCLMWRNRLSQPLYVAIWLIKWNLFLLYSMPLYLNVLMFFTEASWIISVCLASANKYHGC